MSPFFNKHSDLLICIFLVVTTLAVYGQVRTHELGIYDDEQYVTKNYHVQAGLTLESITWAFTATHAANWHPLTWLSHMLDVQLFGMNPGGHHLTNVFFHILNTLILFLVLRRMTGAQWKSAFVAALFALHPLHVESVAWVAERKDVLSTFFWMLTLWAYVRYVEHPGLNRYLLVLLFFALGLLAKPMLVTLPFFLLLIDYWPLGRIQFAQTYSRLLWEKIPFFVLTIASSVVAFFAQKGEGAVGSLIHYPIDVRITNALVSYVGYLGKMVWPFHLAVLYPHPGSLPDWQVAGAGLLLLGITFFAIRIVRQRPFVTVGWLWYLGTLLPVIGLVQLGSQAMADRYTYVPLIGIFVIIAWGIPKLVSGWRYQKIGLASAGAIVLTILMAGTWVQVRYWQNSILLYERTLAVTKNNFIIHNNLGSNLLGQGRLDEAASHFYEALRLHPNYAEAYNNLGAVFYEKGKMNEAASHFRQALEINPKFGDAHYNLGLVLAAQDKLDEAVSHFSDAVRTRPHDPKIHNNLGNALYLKGKTAESIVHYRKALRLKPNHALAEKNLRMALAKLSNNPESNSKIQLALKPIPENLARHYRLGNLHRANGKLDEAIREYEKALSLNPSFVPALNDLALVHVRKGEYDKALPLYKKMLNLRPEDYVAYYNLACLYSKQNKIEASVDWLKEAVNRGFNDWNFLKKDEDLKNIRGTEYFKGLVTGRTGEDSQAP